MRREFFGAMISGHSLDYPAGTLKPGLSITVPIDLVRLWDTGAVPYQILRGNRDGFDGFMNLAQRLNADVLYCFGWHRDLTPWEVCLPGTQVPTPDAWAALVRNVLDLAAGRIKFFEMWNEPAVTSLYWQGGTIQQLLAQSRAGYEIIMERDSSAVVLTPSFNDLHRDYGRDFAAMYLAAMQADHRPSANGIAFHSYGDAEVDYRILRALVAKYELTRLPLYLTETQAPDLGRLFGDMAALGIRCVVVNTQIAGRDSDLDATTDRGRAWTSTYDALTAMLPKEELEERGGCLRWLPW